MPRKYDDDCAKCPFFQSSGRTYIVCEGIINDCFTKLMFETEGQRNRYRIIFCDTQYEKCELFKTLEKKYED